MGASRGRRSGRRPGTRGLAGPAPAGLGPAARGAKAHLCLARRGGVELSRSGRRAWHLDRYGHEPALLCPAEVTSASATLVESAMSFRSGREPTPEQLAAYFDGELEGRDAL